MTEQVELMEMLMAEAGFDDGGMDLPASVPVDDPKPEKIIIDEPAMAAKGVADQLPTLMRVLRSLPLDERAEALEIAQALEINAQSDQLLYSLLVGLGLHKTILKAVPDRMAEAGERVRVEFNSTANRAKTELSQSLTEGAASVIQASDQAASQIQKIVNSASAQIQLAAGKGAQNAVEKFDISPIVEIAISKIASKTEVALAKKWFSRGVIIASISSVLIFAGAGFGGYKIAGLFNSGNASSGDFYLNQLQCSSANNGVIPCRDSFGNVVKFRSK